MYWTKPSIIISNTAFSTFLTEIFPPTDEGRKACRCNSFQIAAEPSTNKIPNSIYILTSVDGAEPDTISGTWQQVYHTSGPISPRFVHQIEPPVLAKYVAVFSTATKKSTQDLYSQYSFDGGSLVLAEIRVYGTEACKYIYQDNDRSKVYSGDRSEASQ